MVAREIVILKTYWRRQWRKSHDDVIKWKHFPRYWPFVRGIHRSPVNSPHIGQSRGALLFSWICAWINGWVNNREACDLRRHHAHYDVTVMFRHKDITVSAYLCDKLASTISSRNKSMKYLVTPCWKHHDNVMPRKHFTLYKPFCVMGGVLLFLFVSPKETVEQTPESPWFDEHVTSL